MIDINIVLNLLKDFILAFLGTLGFAILFEVKKKNLVFSAIVGAVGWIVYVVCDYYHGVFISAFFSSLSIVVLARLFAKIKKTPAPIFYIPGIFPIVPGAGIYNTAYSIVNDNIEQAKFYGINTIKTSFGIVLAIAIVSLLPYSIKKRKKIDKIISDPPIISESENQ